MYCKNCGKIISNDAEVCPYCKSKVYKTEGESFYSDSISELAVAGFVVALFSFLFDYWCIISAIGLILSIAGLFKINTYGFNGKGLAIAGIVVGGALVVCRLVALLFGVYILTILI